MEKRKLRASLRVFSVWMIFGWMALASDPQGASGRESTSQKAVYARKTELDFEGAQIEGELHNPGEFYFQHKPDDKFDSLVKRRKNFHREMMRDVVFSK